MVDLWTEPVLKIYNALDGQMRLVGGCVRDCLLGKKPDDIDIATTIPPKDVLKKLKQNGIVVRPIAMAHGVVGAVVDGKLYEITTLRQDTYTKAGSEKINFIEDYELDAARRDFTINAMSMDRNNIVYDYYGGKADLKKHIVRFIGKPAVRMQEDPLRIYRYVRFWATYGGKKPNMKIVALFPKLRHDLNGVSKQRRKKELLKILTCPRAASALSLMAQTDVLRYAVSGAGQIKHYTDYINTSGRII